MENKVGLEVSNAIDVLIRQKKEQYAIKVLMDSYFARMRRVENDFRAAKASLSAINKINSPNGKVLSGAIDALSSEVTD